MCDGTEKLVDTDFIAVEGTITAEYEALVAQRGEEVSKRNVHMEERGEKHGFDERTVCFFL